MTAGEVAFELFCSNKGAVLERIFEGTQKTPDYFVRVGGYRFVAEVKTLEPNDKEVVWNQQEARGEVYVRGCTPGERLRREIREANKQFKALMAARGEVFPAMLVVLNRTGTWMHTDCYSVRTAMRGNDALDVTVTRNHSAAPAFGPVYSGPEKAMRAGINRTTSAVAILNHLGGLRLDVYHNEFASRPFDVESLRGMAVIQWALPKDARSSLDGDWVEL